MFDHVQIKVADLGVSKAFYLAVMECLGHGVVLEIEGVVVGFGPSVHQMFEIRQAGDDAPLSVAAHLAFRAETREAVDRFHAAALANGGVDNGAPGLRPDYEDGYYAAFAIDPDGHNVEAVCSLAS